MASRQGEVGRLGWWVWAAGALPTQHGSLLLPMHQRGRYRATPTRNPCRSLDTARPSVLHAVVIMQTSTLTAN